MSDDDAFRVFVTRRRAQLEAAAFLLTGDHGHAEDLTQAALLRMYLAWSKVRAADNPSAYARRILYTTFLRSRRRIHVAEGTAELPDVADPSSISDVEHRDEMSRLLYTLPRKQRAVLVLRFYDDLPVDVVARTLNCSPGTVKSQTAKALAKLRSVLQPEESARHD